MNRDIRNSPPPAIAKHGIKGIKTNLPPGHKLKIDTALFVDLFRKELIEFMQQLEESRKCDK